MVCLVEAWFDEKGGGGRRCWYPRGSTLRSATFFFRFCYIGSKEQLFSSIGNMLMRRGGGRGSAYPNPRRGNSGQLLLYILLNVANNKVLEHVPMEMGYKVTYPISFLYPRFGTCPM